MYSEKNDICNFLTVIGHVKQNRADESTEELRQPVDRHFDPGQSSENGHGQRDGGIDMTA